MKRGLIFVTECLLALSTSVALAHIVVWTRRQKVPSFFGGHIPANDRVTGDGRFVQMESL